MDREKFTKLIQEGINLAMQERLDEAIAIFQSIKREDSPIQYTEAQLNLGVALYKGNKIDNAITVFQKIKREDSTKFYAKAQNNIGLIFDKKGEIEKAIDSYKNVAREDLPESYAIAQLNLGVLFEQKQDCNKAIEAYQRITREDSPEIYARAQFYLALLLDETEEEQKDINKIINIYSNITRSDSPNYYAMAQINLGILWKRLNKTKNEIIAYHNIKPEDSKELYARAQLYLGDIFECMGNISEAITAYKNSREYFYFESNSGIMILNIADSNQRSILNTIYNLINNLMNHLIITHETQDFESKFAHYTNPSVAWKLIAYKIIKNTKVEENNKKTSAFRLSLIKNVNDPMEGLTLYKFLQQSCLLDEKFFKQSEITNISKYTFISCFTFNHDSLNQFRLYGKENNQEASGISIVFSRDFFNFNKDNNINAMINLEINKILDYSKEQNSKKDSNSKILLGKQPLYRCIYLDPDTGYISLAKRDKTTFYRELYAEKKDIEEISKESDNKWNIYFDFITNKEEITKLYLQDISYKIKELSSVKDTSVEEKRYIFETLNFILLPLQYLVKHAAFQEEQECRMIYITSLNNEKIQLDWESKQVYIEYEPEVKAHLDKIYLSPGALIYEDFFRHELDDLNNPKKRVRISSNPFRNK